MQEAAKENGKPQRRKKQHIPDTLKCPITKQLLSDAVRLTCCKSGFTDKGKFFCKIDWRRHYNIYGSNVR